MNSSMMSIVILLLLLAAMYFIMIRPQRKREKETTAMRAGLQVGDEIVTIGGICAKVVKTKDASDETSMPDAPEPAMPRANPNQGVPYQRIDEKVGPNDPCPCGSGKKYKKCCGK